MKCERCGKREASYPSLCEPIYCGPCYGIEILKDFVGISRG